MVVTEYGQDEGKIRERNINKPLELKIVWDSGLLTCLPQRLRKMILPLL